ncbi:MAG: zf-HC2 domain-containing protein [Proteobacteria bacterium]|nr:zf-HC2 domain-containing protein [Pseudomonadota bacterium]
MEVSCVDIEILSDIISGNISKEEKTRLIAHLQTCSNCFERVNSALLVLSDSEIDNWSPLPEKEVRRIVNKIKKKTRKPLFSRKLLYRKLIKWREEFGPDLPLVYGYARNASKSPDKPKIEYIHTEKDFSDVKTAILFEKYNDRFNIHIRMNNNAGIKNIRFHLVSDDGQVSRLLKEGHASFEDFPFGTYQLVAVHKQIKKGIYHFDINQRGLENGENTLS